MTYLSYPNIIMTLTVFPGSRGGSAGPAIFRGTLRVRISLKRPALSRRQISVNHRNLKLCKLSKVAGQQRTAQVQQSLIMWHPPGSKLFEASLGAGRPWEQFDERHEPSITVDSPTGADGSTERIQAKSGLKSLLYNGYHQS
ncbi:hypothetical protein LENED_010860 [Lentinula edodes]|uniref:Uncharacterized protein n=1 Tax=Lentinula edodes TaxID=5353 RepID=A0A1Q3ENM0_LENED|nr:hypothetical protein LENED_010860 [Lentinula edodes]